MRVTVRDVLHTPELHLRLVTDPTDSLESAVTWVASSDLADPTPFLDHGTLLLTTGRQFDPHAVGDPTDDQRFTTDAGAYVRRLRDRGVSAIGFGTRVLHTGIPPALLAACVQEGMAMIEVPRHVPFVAVVRVAADLIDAAGHRRGTWALTATRALSTAATRTPPTDALLAELSRRLGRAAILLDATARPRVVHGVSPDDPVVAVARVEAERLLGRGRRAGATIAVPSPGTATPDHAILTMQTVGPDADLRHVLALAGPLPVDPAEQTVIASAVALLWLALVERTGPDDPRRALGQALWRLLARGEIRFVRERAASAGMRLPTAPVRVAVWSPGPGEPVVRALRAAPRDEHPALYAVVDGAVHACVGAHDTALLASVAPTRGVGVSEPIALDALPDAVRRARRAALRAAPGQVVAIDDARAGGLVDLLSTPDAADLARGVLRPLHDLDPRTRDDLVRALRSWLRENGNHGAAARGLGIHRHTLAARVQRAATLLGRDLEEADDRMEIWLALRLTDHS